MRRCLTDPFVVTLNSQRARGVRQCLLFFLALLAVFPGLCSAETQSSPLQDAVILIVRHAEKPESGQGLSTEGVKRAEAYVDYFKSFQVDSRLLKLDCLFAAADSKSSHRPRLTLTPLSQALKLPLNTRFKEKDFQGLANEIQSTAHGKHMLICWHHGAIPDLLHALGADPVKLIPNGKWPGSIFGWLIELRYDHDGRLMSGECRRINEHLMPDDSLPAALEP
jgi:hypothetical protein